MHFPNISGGGLGLTLGDLCPPFRPSTLAFPADFLGRRGLCWALPVVTAHPPSSVPFPASAIAPASLRWDLPGPHLISLPLPFLPGFSDLGYLWCSLDLKVINISDQGAMEPAGRCCSFTWTTLGHILLAPQHLGRMKPMTHSGDPT